MWTGAFIHELVLCDSAGSPLAERVWVHSRTRTGRPLSSFPSTGTVSLSFFSSLRHCVPTMATVTFHATLISALLQEVLEFHLGLDRHLHGFLQPSPLNPPSDGGCWAALARGCRHLLTLQQEPVMNLWPMIPAQDSPGTTACVACCLWRKCPSLVFTFACTLPQVLLPASGKSSGLPGVKRPLSSEVQTQTQPVCRVRDGLPPRGSTNSFSSVKPSVDDAVVTLKAQAHVLESKQLLIRGSEEYYEKPSPWPHNIHWRSVLVKKNWF